MQCGKTLNEIKEDGVRLCDRCNVFLSPSLSYGKRNCPNPRKQHVEGTEYFVYNFRSHQKYFRPVEEKESYFICYICFSKSIRNSYESEREEHSLSFNFQVENEITETQLQTFDTQKSFTLTRFATIDENEITETQIDQIDTQTSCDDTRYQKLVETIDGRQHIPLHTAPLEKALRPQDLNRCENISCHLKVNIVKQEKGIPSIFEELRENGIQDRLLVKTEFILRKVQFILDESFQTNESLEKLVDKAFLGESLEDANIVNVLVRVSYQITSIKKYRPRDVQLISCILILMENECPSQLLEILTGEGKSCVIAMVAASLALINKDVTIDIITSSAILAERDLTDWASFYKYFDISVSTNIKIVSTTKLKECYRNTIVIGTVETFAADFLRHKFQRKGIRGERKFNIAIVDEVDSMLLDRGIQCTYLSEDLQSLRHFEPILAMIWTSVMSIKSSAEKSFFCGKCIPFYQFIMNHTHSCPKIKTAKHFAGSLDVLEFAERQNILPCGFRKNVISAMEESPLTYPQCISNISSETVVQFYRLCERYVTVCCSYSFYELSDNDMCTKIKKEDLKDISNEVNILLLGNGMVCDLVEIDGEPSASIKKLILSEIVFGNAFTEDKIQVPIHLRHLVESQILVWISNAFEAKTMQLEREYLIKENAVYPIDYGCTGMIEMNKKWGDGLQQFLEMKHFLPLTSMGLITNFISNVALFQKYKLIYGATGTIGSDAERDFLWRTYNVKVALIPSHVKSNTLEHQGKIITAKSEWMREICSILNREVQERAALAICEDIKTSLELKGKIEASCRAKNVELYTRNETEEEKAVANTLDQGEIVISTNLAGRGADIKVSNGVNENGGLFVLITFLPLNERVEEQAKGRTARGGKPGSTQVIVLRSTLTGDMQQSRSIKEARIIRTKQAEEKMTKLQRALDDVIKRDQLFKKYCNLFAKIEQNYAKKEEVMVQNIARIMHERWGIWLKVTDTTGITLEKLETQLEAEVDTFLEDYLSCGNIYCMVNIGNILMISKKYDEAILHYNTVIEAAKEWSAVAHYGKAICLLLHNGKKSLGDGLKNLTKASEMLFNNINEQQSTLCYIKNSLQYTKIHTTPNQLFLQIQMRLQLLTFFQENIQVLIKNLKTIPNRSLTDTRTLQSKAVALLCEEFQNQHHDKECDLQVYLKEFGNLYHMGVWQVYALEKIPFYCSNQLFACFIGVTLIAIGYNVMPVTFAKIVIVKGLNTIFGCSEAFDPLHNVSKKEWLFREMSNVARSCMSSSKSSLSTYITKNSEDSTNSNVESQPEDLLEFIQDEVVKAVYSKLNKDKPNAFVINGGITEFQMKLQQIIQSKIKSYFEYPEMIVLTLEMFLLRKEHSRRISDTWKEIEQVYSKIIIQELQKCLNDKEWQTDFKSFIEKLSASFSMPEWMTSIKNNLLPKFEDWFHDFVMKRYKLIRVLYTLNNELIKHVQQKVCENYLRETNRDIAAEAERFIEENMTILVKDIYIEVVRNLPRVQRNPLEKNLILTEIKKIVNINKVHEVLKRLCIVLIVMLNRQNNSSNTHVSEELERCFVDIIKSNMTAERKHVVDVVIHRLSREVVDTENLIVDGLYSAEQCKNETKEVNIAGNVVRDLRKHFERRIKTFNRDSNSKQYVLKNLQSLSIFCVETITNAIYKRLHNHLRAQTDFHNVIADQHEAREHLHYIEELKGDLFNEIKNIVESPEFALANVRVLLSGGELKNTMSAFQKDTEECVETNWKSCECNLNKRKRHSPDTIVDHLSICLYDLTAKIFNKFSIPPADYTYQQLLAETQYFLSMQCTPGVTQTLCDTVFPILVAPIEQKCSQEVITAVNLLMNVTSLLS